jgi:hypothetical protein
MVLTIYSLLTFFGPCPHCNGPLFELSDMWGPFYACEGCGYEFDPSGLEPKHLRPQGQLVFADNFWLNKDNGSRQLSHAACRAQDPGRCPSDTPHSDTIPRVTHIPERDQVTSPGRYYTAPAFGK